MLLTGLLCRHPCCAARPCLQELQRQQEAEEARQEEARLAAEQARLAAQFQMERDAERGKRSSKAGAEGEGGGTPSSGGGKPGELLQSKSEGRRRVSGEPGVGGCRWCEGAGFFGTRLLIFGSSSGVVRLGMTASSS